MGRRAILQPLKAAAGVGHGVAVAGVFVFSALVHEAALNLRVQGGFGLPTLDFLLHGALVGYEKRRRAAPSEERPAGFADHAWTLAWLALPMPLCFHPLFVEQVALPLAGIGA
jgi:hypothetical protein